MYLLGNEYIEVGKRKMFIRVLYINKYLLESYRFKMSIPWYVL